MNYFLNKWQPKNRFENIVKGTVKVVIFIMFAGFLVLPFCQFPEKVKQIIKWVWIGCIALNWDIFLEYKNIKTDRKCSPAITVFTITTLSYLCNYWGLIPVPVVVGCSIVVGILEIVITIAVTKTFRVSEKQEIKEFSPSVINGILLGSLYVCSIVLFFMGLGTSKTMQLVSGCVAVMLLTISVLITISNGVSPQKRIVNIVGFTIDIISLLALMVYLIYLLPQENNLQTIVLTIAASVIGGALALAGVAWTIKQSEKVRKEDLERQYQEKREEEIRKNRPLVFCADSRHVEIKESTGIRFDCPFTNDKIKIRRRDSGRYYFKMLCLRNADYSFSSLKGICCNDDVICFEIAQAFDKNKNYRINFEFEFDYNEEIKEISLLLVDLLEKYYILTTNYTIEKRMIAIQSGIELIPVKVDFENLTITKEVK